MTIRVTAPNRRFNGRINADQFFRGVCDDAAEANLPYYRRQGFTIGDAADAEDLPSAVPPDADEVLAKASAAVAALAKREAAEAAPADAEETPAAPAPKRNAPRSVWVEFLSTQGVTVDDGASRDDLIEAWEQSQA